MSEFERQPSDRRGKGLRTVSLALGLAGVLAFIVFFLIRYGLWGPEPRVNVEFRHELDWLPGIIALAGITGGIVGFVDALDGPSTFGRIGRGLALLNMVLALIAFSFWLAYVQPFGD